MGKKSGGAKMRTGTFMSAGSRGTGMNGKQSSSVPKKAPQVIVGTVRAPRQGGGRGK